MIELYGLYLAVDIDIGNVMNAMDKPGLTSEESFLSGLNFTSWRPTIGLPVAHAMVRNVVISHVPQDPRHIFKIQVARDILEFT